MNICSRGFAKFVLFSVLIMLAACIAAPTQAGVWSIADDFSTTTNPNGDWTYGVYLADGHGYPFYNWEYFQLWAGMPNFAKWGNPGEDLGAGAIFYNPDTTDLVSGTQWLRPGEVAIFPANLGWGYTPVIRWTAPEAMTIAIDAAFRGHDETTTDVHVLLNGDMTDGPEWGSPTFTGTQLMDGVIDGNYGCVDLSIPQSGTIQEQTYAGVITVAAGDTIDFVVGYGPNHFYGGDLTGVTATITTVPEPSTLVILVLGVLGMICWRKTNS
jgi:hypothetical protein